MIRNIIGTAISAQVSVVMITLLSRLIWRLKEKHALAPRRTHWAVLLILSAIGGGGVLLLVWTLLQWPGGADDRVAQQRQAGNAAEKETSYEEMARLQQGGQARVAPVAVLSINALIAEYRENEFAAAAKYENVESLRVPCLGGDRNDGCRVVETSGTIRDMGRDINGDSYIRLATADGFVGVEARFGKAEYESLQALRRGQRVSVRCMVLYDPTTYRASEGLLLTRCGVVAP